MSNDLQAQLAILRRRIERIDGKYREPLRPERYPAEQILSGQEVENECGRCFVSERFFPSHRRHGSVELERLNEIGAGRWAFLDTETTGLAGGTGTCAFLVGVGTVEESGFRIRLFFMRDYHEEAAMLAAVTALLAQCDRLVTYNGKSYDVPLLETRFRLQRRPAPFAALDHLDLLHSARRLWRLRLESRRLVELETRILGVEREGDLPGEMIPYYYFEYLRTRQAFRLVPLFHHNVMDILTLAALTAVVVPAFKDPAGSGLCHGEDLLGLARWLAANGNLEQALELYGRAVERGLRDPNLFAALWETAQIEKKLGRLERAIALWRDLAGCRNPVRRQALEELAKYYEHAERDYPKALEATVAALRLEPLPALEHRRRRLERKAAAPPTRLL